ncbi:leucine-rich repeat-containing protein 74A-like isoform X2 [Mizuhopecten yessoensis]|uniref:leucine-rich repeat-containing protein 74A-like isoform X2 n=1 Tax=Mizuhopecten yessoensis TaxID=6573 RepID=UPI000B4584AA|nr:leucine-rich repeat-containing protein 74A-like isoform X2 [Mizuhopecten yessoensis]
MANTVTPDPAIFDMFNFVTRCKTGDSYSIMTKYRMNRPGATRRAKSAHIRRIKGDLCGSERSDEHARAESADMHSVTTATDLYDFDKDFPDDLDQDDEEDYEHRPSPTLSPSQQVYHKACRQLKVVISKHFSRNLVKDSVIMRHHELGPKGGKACALALMNNSTVATLDLTDNDLGPAGGSYVGELLQENHFISDLTLADNNMKIDGTKGILKAISDYDCVTSLNLSGNGLRECDAEAFQPVIEDTTKLTRLNLSHNEFREEGGEVIGQAIEFSETLTDLDLSWNHLRLSGGVSLAIGLQLNRSIKRLNLAWNGLYIDGCKAMATALEVNRSLEELDLSSNRINKECLEKLLAGVKKNPTLKVLKLALNPLTTAGAAVLLSTVKNSTDHGLKIVDIHTQVVEQAYATQATALHEERGIEIKHGIVRGQEGSGDDPDGMELVDENPVLVLMEFGKLMGFRLMDLFAALDKDGSKSLDKVEIMTGLKFANIPLTDKALDKLIEKLDEDGSGEIEFSEMMAGQQEYRAKMNKMYKATQQSVDVEDTEIGRVRIKLQRLMAKQMANNPAFKSRVERFQQSLSKGFNNGEIAVRMTGNKRDLNREKVRQRRETKAAKNSSALFDLSGLENDKSSDTTDKASASTDKDIAEKKFKTVDVISEQSDEAISTDVITNNETSVEDKSHALFSSSPRNNLEKGMSGKKGWMDMHV